MARKPVSQPTPAAGAKPTPAAGAKSTLAAGAKPTSTAGAKPAAGAGAAKSIISPFHGNHDHANCQREAMNAALAQCQQRGLRLTKTRLQVLEIIWGSHNPIGAYDVLQQLQQQGHKPAPPTAYRALEFLVEAQLIHRIESLNAYIGCPSPQDSHQCQFYICKECGHTAEVNSSAVAEALTADAAQLGFSGLQPVIEVHGLCDNCRQA